jgi:hypothetical protein
MSRRECAKGYGDKKKGSKTEGPVRASHNREEGDLSPFFLYIT